jgi:nudix-type nucleoside diphosphatase (YffH/AdpP family)
LTAMAPQLIDTETAYAGWCKLLIATIRMPDGQTYRREVEHHGMAASVLPYDPVRRTAIVIRQPRAPALYLQSEPIIEAVAGLIDPGEEMETSARRECLEEAGLRLASIAYVTTAWTMPGISTERMGLFLGEYSQADRIAVGGGLAAEHEQIEVVEMTLRDLTAMIDSGKELDMKLLVLMQTLRLRRPELFTPA